MLPVRILALSVGLLAAASCATAFTVGTVPGAPGLSLRAAAQCSSRASQFVAGRDLTLRANLPRSRAAGGMTSVKMGLFGLGWPELAVIGVVVALIFGPSNIAGLGKDLGKLAGSIKKEASTFSEAMSESLAEAEKEYKAGESESEPVAKKSQLDQQVDKAMEKPVDKPVEKPVPKKKVDLSD